MHAALGAVDAPAIPSEDGLAFVRVCDDVRTQLAAFMEDCSTLTRTVPSTIHPRAHSFAAAFSELAHAHRDVTRLALRHLCIRLAEADDAVHHDLLWSRISAAGIGPGDPYAFQRSFDAAITARLRATRVNPRALQRKHALYPRAPARRVIASKASSSATGSSATARAVTLEPLPSESLLPSVASVSIDTSLAVRADATPEACIAAGVPYEIELTRVPLHAAIAPHAAAASTMHAWDGLMSCLDSYSDLLAVLTRGGAEGEEEEESIPSSPRQRGAAGSDVISAIVRDLNLDEEDETDALILAATRACLAPHSDGAAPLVSRSERALCPLPVLPGCAAVPQPSATLPRASMTTSAQLLVDYIAHAQLSLSPYFSDACGLYDYADSVAGAGGKPASLTLQVAASKNVGPTLYIAYEYIPDMIPLTQLLRHCGRMSESSALFRCIAANLARACRDIDMCTLSLQSSHHALNVSHVYVSDGGSRLTLRGVGWGTPLPQLGPEAARQRRQRSIRIVQFYGTVVRLMLCAPPVVSGDAEAPLRVYPYPPQHTRVVRRAQAEVGVDVLLHEEFHLLLPLPPGGDARPRWTIDADAAVSARTPLVRVLSSVEEEHAHVSLADGVEDGGSSVRTPPRSHAGGSRASASPTRSTHTRSHASSGVSGRAGSPKRVTMRRFTRLRCVASGAGSDTLLLKLDAPGGRGDSIMCPVTVRDTHVSPTLSALLDVCVPPSGTAHPIARGLLHIAELMRAYTDDHDAPIMKQLHAGADDAPACVRAMAGYVCDALCLRAPGATHVPVDVRHEHAMQAIREVVFGSLAQERASCGYRMLESMAALCEHPYIAEHGVDAATGALQPVTNEFLTYAYVLMSGIAAVTEAADAASA